MPKTNRTRRGGIPVEMMEGRVLLSAGGHAHTNVIYRPATTMSPDAFELITPADMVQAYGVNQIKFGSIKGDGTGQTIAIIDAYGDPTAASDLAQFDSTYNLPAANLQVYDQNGGTNYPNPPPPNSTDSGWTTEESLDIEWAHVIAPGANLILYEANTTSDSDLIGAALVTAKNNPNVTEVSMSWGSGEFSGEDTEDSYFTSSHETFLAATGDQGYPGSYPAFSPNVVAVGGTTLSTDSNGNYLSETGWSDSGGGPSQVEPRPSYQNGFQSTSTRTIPDVAMDADPYNSPVPVYSGGQLDYVGGTSLACPMVAGLIAVANQGRVLNGLSVFSSSQALPLIYQSASNYLQSTYTPAPTFHDITSGNNGGASAGQRYDEVTGLGTPVANLLVPYLAGTKPTVTSFSGSPNPVTAGSTLTLTANVTDPDVAVTQVAFYRESNGTSGLQTSGDTFLGNGTPNGSGGWTLNTSTSGLSGNVTYYAVPTDASGITGATASTTVTVTAGVTAPTLTGAPVINGDNPNGLYNAPGQTTAGTQRSMVEDVVYTFNEPVTIPNANTAFTVVGAGAHPGTAPTTLFAQAVPNTNGTQWAVSLTGQAEGTIASIANGEYTITLNPNAVFAAADGTTSMAPGTGRTDNFYRLYGDIFGTRNVNNADYNLFKKSINTYNPAFDDFGTGTTSSNADYNVFKKDLNIDYSSDGFVTTI